MFLRMTYDVCIIFICFKWRVERAWGGLFMEVYLNIQDTYPPAQQATPFPYYIYCAFVVKPHSVPRKSTDYVACSRTIKENRMP